MTPDVTVSTPRVDTTMRLVRLAKHQWWHSHGPVPVCLSAPEVGGWREKGMIA